MRERIPDRAFFHDFVRAIFFHRRKYLRSELTSLLKGRLGKPSVDAILVQTEIEGNARAEQLSIDKILDLCREVQAELAQIDASASEG